MLVMRTNRLRIEIYSDLICPWCYIGRHRLQAALGTLDEAVKPDIHWLPFQLNPDMPKTGLDRRTYRSAKFGSWERFAIITKRKNYYSNRIIIYLS